MKVALMILARAQYPRGWICAVLVALTPLDIPCSATGATITNVLTYPFWQQFAVAVNTGDTVVWVNQAQASNYVSSYGGEWNSGPLSFGNSFSYTFTNAGFYAYGTAIGSGGAWSGTVTVAEGAGGPPSVTINTPVDGMILLSGVPELVQASFSGTQEVTAIEYSAATAAGTNLIGIGTSPPYGVQWTNSAPGRYVLSAKSIGLSGAVSWSEAVTVTLDASFRLWGARVLPNGQSLFFYNCYGGGPMAGYANRLAWCADALFTSDGTLAIPYSPGVVVDDNLPLGPAASRFYRLSYIIVK